jgi:hypothetical protein
MLGQTRELRIALTEVMTVTQYTKSADLNSVIERLQLIVNYLATHPEHQPDLAALLRKKLRAIVWRQPGSSSSPVPPDEATSDIIAICAGWLPRVCTFRPGNRDYSLTDDS